MILGMPAVTFTLLHVAMSLIGMTQTEAPFLVAQVVVLAAFCGFGFLAARRFRLA
jgi:hypothetical protein